PGSVIIAVGACTGGNGAASKPGETVVRDGVSIVAPLNLAGSVPAHASQLYSRHSTAFLALLIQDGNLKIDLNDDVVGPACVTHEGKIINARVAAALEQPTAR